jgi:hypothetical protein
MRSCDRLTSICCPDLALSDWKTAGSFAFDGGQAWPVMEYQDISSRASRIQEVAEKDHVRSLGIFDQ